MRVYPIVEASGFATASKEHGFVEALPGSIGRTEALALPEKLYRFLELSGLRG
jgi:hypothetical protein